MKKNSKRKKIKKLINGIGLGVLCCTCIYTTMVYAAIKTLVKYDPEDYNNGTKY